MPLKGTSIVFVSEKRQLPKLNADYGPAAICQPLVAAE
jgi:hypothetical protein